MKKRICKLTSLLLALCILLSLVSCGSKNTYENSMIFGDPDAEDALRICIDIDFRELDESNKRRDQAIKEFVSLLQNHCGLENVVIQIIPDLTVPSERNIMLSRLRTEIMSGYGPDVFIMQCIGNSTIIESTESLFPYPQQAMENALFLPLDTYMENNTQYTEWDAQEQAILDAGRNEEGQQIIPLAYTFPLMVCSKLNVDIELPDKPLTLDDALSDPVLQEYYKDFVDCANFHTMEGLNGTLQDTMGFNNYLSYIIGDIADFEKEELLFTEDELVQRTIEILEMMIALEEEGNTEPSVFSEGFFSRTICRGTPVTMLPLYSIDGGIAAEITHFAAINRNTKLPEEAYKVIDLLLREETQMKSNLFVSGVCEFDDTAPLHGGTFSRETAFRGSYYLDEASFEKLTAIKEQITAVNFQSELTSDLDKLTGECYMMADQANFNPEALARETYRQLQRKVRE